MLTFGKKLKNMSWFSKPESTIIKCYLPLCRFTIFNQLKLQLIVLRINFFRFWRNITDFRMLYHRLEKQHVIMHMSANCLQTPKGWFSLEASKHKHKHQKIKQKNVAKCATEASTYRHKICIRLSKNKRHFKRKPFFFVFTSHYVTFFFCISGFAWFQWKSGSKADF